MYILPCAECVAAPCFQNPVRLRLRFRGSRPSHEAGDECIIYRHYPIVHGEGMDPTTTLPANPRNPPTGRYSPSRTRFASRQASPSSWTVFPVSSRQSSSRYRPSRDAALSFTTTSRPSGSALPRCCREVRARCGGFRQQAVTAHQGRIHSIGVGSRDPFEALKVIAFHPLEEFLLS